MSSTDIIMSLASAGIKATPDRIETLKRWLILDSFGYESDEDAGQAVFIEASKMLAEKAGVTVDVLISKSRKRELVEARNILFFILQKKTNLRLKSMGEKIGGRDHSTAIHNIETFHDLWETSANFRKFATPFINHFNIKL